MIPVNHSVSHQHLDIVVTHTIMNVSHHSHICKDHFIIASEEDASNGKYAQKYAKKFPLIFQKKTSIKERMMTTSDHTTSTFLLRFTVLELVFHARKMREALAARQKDLMQLFRTTKSFSIRTENTTGEQYIIYDRIQQCT